MNIDFFKTEQARRRGYSFARRAGYSGARAKAVSCRSDGTVLPSALTGCIARCVEVDVTIDLETSSLPPHGVLSVRSRRTGNVIALYRPLIIIHLARKLDGEEIAIVRKVVAEGLQEGVEGGMLVVFAREDLSDGLDPRARGLFEQLIRTTSGRAGMSAVVILSQGFAGAVVRGALAGLLPLAARRGQLRSFATVREACEALAKSHGLESTDLTAAYYSSLVDSPPP